MLFNGAKPFEEIDIYPFARASLSCFREEEI